MRKLVCMLVALFVMSQVTFAQDKKATKKDAPKTELKAADAKATKLKKDGTPDMRHKENKEAAAKAAPAGPLKKDGTPDMRHKANKDAAKKDAAKKDAPKQK
ncbi:hypothetical protein CJD36_017565 [Flavipsychrobacter stenotrophus]|uniref:Pentapeptide MXKDX repeat protein n=1 Tax=Flavipsychrobacter stenotrophus TaxID=2077091 RepID=A0A2S7ST06_9BACT|nr:hypothetical protein [Flavipsychrobacter stenotrophus]PQJ09737.1 hypothetical protein CJD36_017565 [Flavipsychrobacter stenotrophus]